MRGALGGVARQGSAGDPREGLVGALVRMSPSLLFGAEEIGNWTLHRLAALSECVPLAGRLIRSSRRASGVCHVMTKHTPLFDARVLPCEDVFEFQYVLAAWSALSSLDGICCHGMVLGLLKSCTLW